MTVSLLGTCLAPSAPLGLQANALDWKEEEMAIWAPLPFPPESVVPLVLLLSLGGDA